MKKIFTSISVAALSLMAATPVFADRQKTLTDQEKAAVVKTIVPAVFDQVKQLSGVDFMALTNPSIENIVNTPLFFPQTATLRAGQLNPISMTPDSMKLDLSTLDFTSMGVPASLVPMIQGIVNDIKLTFKNYKEYSVPFGDRTVNLKLPETIDVNSAAMTGDDGKPVNLLSLNFVTGAKGIILPFNSLSIELKLDGLAGLAGAIPNFPLKSGKFLTIAETQSTTGKLEYDVTLEENLRALVSSMAQMPNFQISVDLTKLMTAGTIEAGLYGKPLQNPNAKLPMGDATIYANLKATSGMPADSIILTSYDATTAKIAGYKKLTPVLGVAGTNLKLTTSSAVRADVKDEWTPVASQIITMPASMSTVIGSMMSSLVNGVIGNLKSLPQANFDITIDSIYADKPEVTVHVMKINVATKLEATGINENKVVADINFQTNKEGELKHSMNIQAILPGNKPLVQIEFRPGETMPEKPMATAYITSDLLEIVTSNEVIAPGEELKVLVADGGLYIQNCEKGTYSIVGMNSQVVAQGIISGTGSFIATPMLTKGTIYIFSVVDNGVRQSIKFRK